ncbi:unnamed protein product [Spirodela intermedia]|uniref:RING-type domain-containing protein n=1 Tax=Spirodela intermedia TaxID=51605 RepID=A0A7I8J797_SPIIN|nr:unnamed protein product [Spirodela intermedia]CAA6665605.1 unnamed protein product [Spirodela intermedia]
MGNKLGKRRQAVDEKYTRPQGLYQNQNFDHKKVRKQILRSKLAPCYPGGEERIFDREECPICFLYYPSLNRSKCCTKGICTECYLQMKSFRSTRSSQCPFCKSSNYEVDYRGMMTKEERRMEKIEEQKVIEAKIRMQQQERLDEEERIERRKIMDLSNGIMNPGGIECRELPSSSSSDRDSTSFIKFFNATMLLYICRPKQWICFTSDHTCFACQQEAFTNQTKQVTDDFDLDLEDIMVMEAIWLSIQENGGGGASSDPSCSGPSFREDSPSGGLACAVASLAERQVVENHHHHLHPPDSWMEVTSGGGGRAAAPEEDLGGAATSPAEHVPDSFEEQVMLAMAISLAEARGRRRNPEEETSR